MRRRPVAQYSSMTSLLDVLFILVFASLIYSASMRRESHSGAAAEPLASSDAGVADAGPATLAPAAAAASADAGTQRGGAADSGDAGAADRLADVRRLRDAARAALVRRIDGRHPVLVRITRDGVMRAIEQLEGDQVSATPMTLPLVEKVDDPDVALVYQGDRNPALRLCALVRLELDRPDLSDALVIVAPDAPLAELSVALAGGLSRDVERCLADQRGIAALVDPEEARPR